MRIIRKIKQKIMLHTSPVKYWRSQGAVIGERCEIYSSANFGSEPYLITIGNHVRVNDGVQFVTHDGGVWVLREMSSEFSDIDKIAPITVGDNVHIGTGAFIMPGVNIGNNVIVGAGAIVTKDIPDNSVAVGVPARVIRTIEQYRDKNMEAFIHTKNMTREQKKKWLLERYKK